MNKIVSFGDSFTFGSELENNDDGSKAWPGLIAEKLKISYATLAVPGCGNESIARQIYTYFSSNPGSDVIAIVNWTWPMRWDFYITTPIKRAVERKLVKNFVREKDYSSMAGSDWPTYDDFCNGVISDNPAVETEIDTFLNSLSETDNGKWITLGPTCVPSKLNFLNSQKAQSLINIYNDFYKESLLWHRYRSLQSIFAAQQYLKNKNIKSIQTYMDYDMLNSEHPALSPTYIIELQNLIKDELTLFDQDKNFLDWARVMNYKVTPSPGDHPLEEAHEHASNLYLKKVMEMM
jgi:hypothetical protein